MTEWKREQSSSEFENVNEVLSVADESKKGSKKGKTSENADGKTVLENLNEVITFDVPVSDVMTLNE